MLQGNVLTTSNLVEVKMKNNSHNRKVVDYIDSYVGSRVKIRRLLLGLTQEEVGKAIGVDPEQIKKYERGVSKIYGAALYRLGKCLDVSISYFFEKVEDKMKQNLSTGHTHLVVNERELVPLVKAYQEMSHMQDRQKVSDLMLLFAG